MRIDPLYRLGRLLTGLFAALIAGDLLWRLHADVDLGSAPLSPVFLFALAGVVLSLFGLGFVCVLRDEDRSAASRRAWMWTMILLPVTGALVFFTVDWIQRDEPAAASTRKPRAAMKLEGIDSGSRRVRWVVAGRVMIILFLASLGGGIVWRMRTSFFMPGGHLSTPLLFLTLVLTAGIMSTAYVGIRADERLSDRGRGAWLLALFLLPPLGGTIYLLYDWLVGPRNRDVTPATGR
jgi:uncharacterized membrane protein YhaH (DUF805 family)